MGNNKNMMNNIIKTLIKNRSFSKKRKSRQKSFYISVWLIEKHQLDDVFSLPEYSTNTV